MNYDAQSQNSQDHETIETQRVSFGGNLHTLLYEMNGRSYAQLKTLTGKAFQLNENSVQLLFRRVQPDPFAPGSQVSISFPFVGMEKIIQELRKPSVTPLTDSEVAQHVRVAVEDFLLREFHKHRSQWNRAKAVEVLIPSQHILPRSAIIIEQKTNTAILNLRIKLPGHGRRIDGKGISQIIFHDLFPVIQGPLGTQLRLDLIFQHCVSVLDQEWLRRQLDTAELVAFIPNGSILARESGDSDTPMQSQSAVPFSSPDRLTRTFTLPYSGNVIKGMGIPKGLTLIAGGGFHGKSTLLRAVEVGIYNHVPADGRTFAVTDPTAMKIRSEDRRSIQGVDISSFINNLPFKKSTTDFCTENASGSTSQAANVIESLELGVSLLLLDEDTSATNFIYRDDLMCQLVPDSREPITPFVRHVEKLFSTYHVSTIMVTGGSGQYFSQANTVLVLDNYHIFDRTEEAKAIRSKVAMNSESSCCISTQSFDKFQRRLNYTDTFSFRRTRNTVESGSRYRKVSAVGDRLIRMGDWGIDLGFVEQIVEEGQLNGIAQCLAHLWDNFDERFQNQLISSPVTTPSLLFEGSQQKVNNGFSLNGSSFKFLVFNSERNLRSHGLESNTSSYYSAKGFTSLPRPMEIGAALNRLRVLRINKR